MGAGASAQLLAAAVHDRLQVEALPDHQHPHPLGPPQLVTGHGEQIEASQAHRERDRRLHGVGVDGHLRGHRPHRIDHLVHRLDDTGLVVGPHDRHHRGLRPHGGRQLGRVDPPAGIDPHHRHRHAHPLQEPGRLQHRLVLGRHRHHPSRAGTAQGAALYRQVVGLRATAGEHHLQGAAAQHRRHPLPRRLQGVLGGPGHGMETGRVAEGGGVIGSHRLGHPGAQWGGGGVVDVDHGAMIAARRR